MHFSTRNKFASLDGKSFLFPWSVVQKINKLDGPIPVLSCGLFQYSQLISHLAIFTPFLQLAAQFVTHPLCPHRLLLLCPVYDGTAYVDQGTLCQEPGKAW